MAFNSPPPIDPNRAKANLVVADEHRRQRVHKKLTSDRGRLNTQTPPPK